MAKTRGGADGLLVVGGTMLALGVLLSYLGFQRAASATAMAPYGGEPPVGLMLMGGLVATAGLATLAWWLAWRQARYVVGVARPEIAAAVRDGVAQAAPLACASCGTRNPADAKHCKECGDRLGARPASA